MPKAKKIVVCREGVQVYPVDDAEGIWHIWDKDGPIAEIQFITGPTDTDEQPELVVQNDPDYIALAIPERYHFWRDER